MIGKFIPNGEHVSERYRSLLLAGRSVIFQAATLKSYRTGQLRVFRPNMHWRALRLPITATVFTAWFACALWLDFHGSRRHVANVSQALNSHIAAELAARDIADVAASGAIRPGQAQETSSRCSDNRRRKRRHSVAAVIVPGCWLARDGLLSAPFLSRIARAVDIFRELTAPTREEECKDEFECDYFTETKVLMAFTGGGGEAELARAHAVSVHGVPLSVTRYENRSRTTFENAAFLRDALLSHASTERSEASGGEESVGGLSSSSNDGCGDTRSVVGELGAGIAAGSAVSRQFMVISDSYHLLRCRSYFTAHFERSQIVVIPSFSPFPDRVYGALREAGALVKNILLGQLDLSYVLSELSEDARYLLERF